eukprot:CAMPEP_0197824438 /NCGR_PEP_ID=MMETSP1437-20131217/1679_1 /TAXON_ID=49252 ORGANISM="Eucampia antarctica, Strain CCMP1452" /NCGR_SAMPLE_ID=MMETSP1437 /ASSEMBLY_ACC=CAM_ASM_001096 /LENGTH=134 /DNA_ID=CAMNT_0043424059 /DNA_START=41 /DNA_END=445 /DNA_ORIENTATION=-
MNKAIVAFLLIVAMATSSVSGFSIATGTTGVMNGGSSFTVAQRHISSQSPAQQCRRGDMSMMGGKMAKFGVFSPAVYGAKIALGEPRLNKFRGKAISLHSQYIGEFCQWAGAYHLRTKIIKLAKTNGDTLGFLV